MSFNFCYKLTFIKACTWRVIATGVNVAAVALLSGKFTLGFLGLFAVADCIIKILLFMAHERAWHSIFKRKNALHQTQNVQGDQTDEEGLP